MDRNIGSEWKRKFSVIGINFIFSKHVEFYCYNINKLINLIRLELFTQPPLAGRSQHESSAPFRMEINSVHTFQPRVPDFNYNPGMHRGNKSGRATHKSATSSPRNPAEI